MGLLDDAIREHLDLKRRRGADPAEIERAEREALGPVRRNREPGLIDEADAGEETQFDPGLGSGHEEIEQSSVEDRYDDPYAMGSRASDESESVFDDEGFLDQEEPLPREPAAEDGVFIRDEQPAAVEEDDPHQTQLMDTVRTPAEPPAAAPAVESAPALEPAPPVEPETAEHTAAEPVRDDDPFGEDEPFAEEQPVAGEDHRPAPSDEEDEDMLEETPEFLQDTPDHDRLWFEQRPPRDFDFDG